MLSLSVTPVTVSPSLAPAAALSATGASTGADPSLHPATGDSHFDRLVQHYANDDASDRSDLRTEADRRADNRPRGASNETSASDTSASSSTDGTPRARKRSSDDDANAPASSASAKNDTTTDPNAVAAAGLPANVPLEANGATLQGRVERQTQLDAAGGTRDSSPGTRTSGAKPMDAASTPDATEASDADHASPFGQGATPPDSSDASALPANAAAPTAPDLRALRQAAAQQNVNALAAAQASGHAGPKTTAVQTEDRVSSDANANSALGAATARTSTGAGAAPLSGDRLAAASDDARSTSGGTARSAGVDANARTIESAADQGGASSGGDSSQQGRGSDTPAAPDARLSSEAAQTFKGLSIIASAAGPSVESVVGAAASSELAATTLDQDGAGAVSQIVQTMRVVANSGGGTATVTLEPQYLGGVTVSLTVDRDAVTASVQADSPSVREWLRSNEGLLRDSLTDQGLRLDRLDIAEPSATPRRDTDSDASSQSSARERRQPPPKPQSTASDTAFEVIV